MFVLIFQTRDCRGGKGERSIFHQLFIHMHATCEALLPLIAEYGSFKDYFHILALLDDGNNEEDEEEYEEEEEEGEQEPTDEQPPSLKERLQQAIIDLLVKQLKQDEHSFEEE